MDTSINNWMFFSSKKREESYISADVKISCKGIVSECASKGFSYSGKIQLSTRFEVVLYFAIDYSNSQKQPQDAYEIVRNEIRNEEIGEPIFNEYDMEIIVDEDIYALLY